MARGPHRIHHFKSTNPPAIRATHSLNGLGRFDQVLERQSRVVLIVKAFVRKSFTEALVPLKEWA